MVNIGFKAPELQRNSSLPGQPDWWISIKPEPALEALAARVSTPTAHALFESPEHAMIYHSHPGLLPLMAGYYLRWVEEQEAS